MRIGLVLSGGIAKGAYQAGFLKAVEDFWGRESIVAVAGSSIGSLNGYAFCANKTDLLIDLWKKVHFESLVDLVYSVWRSKYLKKMVKQLLDKNDFLDIPMYSPICYLPLLHMNYGKLSGRFNPKWYKFLRGAMCFPVLAGGIRFFRGQIAIDGGMMDNVPVLPLVKKENLDLVLVVHFTPTYRPRKIAVDEGIPIIDFDIALNSKYQNRSFDFHEKTLSKMIEDGYQYGKRVYDEIFLNSESILDVLKKEEQWKIFEENDRKNGIIVETCIQKLNEIFYPFMRHDCKNIIDLKVKKLK